MVFFYYDSKEVGGAISNQFRVRYSLRNGFFNDKVMVSAMFLGGKEELLVLGHHLYFNNPLCYAILTNELRLSPQIPPQLRVS